jgi:hypothetical protein
MPLLSCLAMEGIIDLGSETCLTAQVTVSRNLNAEPTRRVVCLPVRLGRCEPFLAGALQARAEGLA